MMAPASPSTNISGSKRAMAGLVSGDSGIPEKRCTTCKRDKPRSMFTRNRCSPDGLAYTCRECRRESRSRRDPILVSNHPLREAFLRSGLSSWDVARALGHFRNEGPEGRRVPDATPVRRALGLAPEPPSSGHRFRQRMRPRTALRYAKVLNLDLFEIGL